ncbi:asparaginase [Micromonospora sp. ATCC 39149]|uniref:Asparaginase n=1 Tax=Micromonospora carbonacea TaxID=47853 RepID=A0A7D6CDQ0_9ACTN|nr:asparaginase [Micromonospora sp. ATCC 39149]QLJ98570.1 asparaginase [Micromonospora carbonacea]
MAPRVLLVATKDIHAYGQRDTEPTVFTGAQLLTGIPTTQLSAEVSVEDVMTEPSWDMSPATMLTLARRVRAAILDDGYDGVVVTHGIDTMEETAFLADLLAGAAATRAGIVFTGATRRADELSADGPRNLASAITAACDPALHRAGAVLCLNDELHAARWATNVNAGVTAFSSAPFPLLAHVVANRVVPVAAPPPRPPDPVGQPASDVALIKTYPGMESTLLTAAVDAGAAGIVLEGTGVGNVPASLFATISDLTEWGIPVVVASRCHTTTNPSLPDPAYVNGLAMTVGAISARGLSGPKARAALMVALGTGSAVRARQWLAQL